MVFHLFVLFFFPSICFISDDFLILSFLHLDSMFHQIFYSINFAENEKTSEVKKDRKRARRFFQVHHSKKQNKIIPSNMRCFTPSKKLIRNCNTDTNLTSSLFGLKKQSILFFSSTSASTSTTSSPTQQRIRKPVLLKMQPFASTNMSNPHSSNQQQQEKYYGTDDAEQQQQQHKINKPKQEFPPVLQRILDNIEKIMSRRRRVPLRVLASILSAEEQEQILNSPFLQRYGTKTDSASMVAEDTTCNDNQQSAGSLFVLVQNHGNDRNGLFLSQNFAGVWFVERSFDDERVKMEQRITEYDATANLHDAAVNPSKYSKVATNQSSWIGDQPFDLQKVQTEATDVFNTVVRPYLPCGFFIPLPALVSSIPPSVLAGRFTLSQQQQQQQNDNSGGTFFKLQFPSSSSSTNERQQQQETLQQQKNISQNNSSNDTNNIIQNLFNWLSRMKSDQVDVRVFGDKPSDVFVRGVCENVDFDESKDLLGEQRHSKYDIAVFAGALYSSLKGKGKIPIGDLPDHLPPDLLFRLPLKQYHSILIFDRMPHLFYVNTQKYVIEAKDFSSSSTSNSTSSTSDKNNTSHHHHQIITSLLVKTSPCPSELRFIVDNLTQPVALHVVERELPKQVRNRIKCFFASLSDFVAAHSAYLFIEGDERFPVLNSHRLEQEMRDQRNAQLEAMEDENGEPLSYYNYNDGGSDDAVSGSSSDPWENNKYLNGSSGGNTSETINEKRKRHRDQRRAAIEIAKFLPDSNGIPLHILRQRLPAELESKIYKKHPRHFFDMFPDLFNTFVLFHSPMIPFVQHASLPMPVNCVPKVRTEADCVRVVCLFLLHPRRLDVVFGTLPFEARMMIERRFRMNLLRFLRVKCARWFAVFHDRFTGEPSAMYIGHFPEEKRESVRRRLIEESATPPSMKSE